MSHKLAGKVCLVTGATRGIGKGIALQLGEYGAKVYITGRTLKPKVGAKVGGSLLDTAEEIRERGGECVPIQCDHAVDEQVEKVFDQIKEENDGQLDILVNNTYSAVQGLFQNQGMPFWEAPITTWDDVNRVGLRNHYICAIYAARMMVPRKKGLIVNVSSPGGLTYFINPAYGIGKEACDRMAADCAYELRTHNVAFVSLWPGLVGTENIINSFQEQIKNTNGIHRQTMGSFRKDPTEMLALLKAGETPEFSGMCVAELASDPNVMKKSGRILPTCELAREYGLKDYEGHASADIRQLKYIMYGLGYIKSAQWIPGFIRIPKWLMYFGGYKF